MMDVKHPPQHQHLLALDRPHPCGADEPYVFSVGVSRAASCSRRMSDPGGRLKTVVCIPHEYYMAETGRGGCTSALSPWSSSSSDDGIEDCEAPHSKQALANQERARFRWCVPLLPAAAFSARQRSRAASLPRLDLPLIETKEEDDGLEIETDAASEEEAKKRRPPLRFGGRCTRQHLAIGGRPVRRHSESLSLEVISEDADWLEPNNSATRRFSCCPDVKNNKTDWSEI